MFEHQSSGCNGFVSLTIVIVAQSFVESPGNVPRVQLFGLVELRAVPLHCTNTVHPFVESTPMNSMDSAIPYIASFDLE